MADATSSLCSRTKTAPQAAARSSATTDGPAIVKAAITGCVLIARDVGSIVVGQDLQVTHLASDAAHEQFAVSESLVLKIEAPDAICTIASESKKPATRRK